MARYTCSYKFPVSTQQIYSIMTEIFDSCQLQIEFQSNDYIMAKEIKNKIYYSHLVKVDVMINLFNINQNSTTINLIVQNEELALNKDNHAREKLEEIQQTIAQKYQGELLTLNN